ncbi:energy-coupling factor transporter ATPase [Desulfallas thermosapovorans]|uniref:Energy-coupling factor transport system ATP-binding protein n=1 Tax=Desulfallas thermosapovorans DSM 6562 TaxID=1121431 RepID=A0A5S4ZP38_9FIRM|nr:energy-coupling factor transporter ATPase [Desulfallas thermosapovorans]TYO93817.1 energy-coupling factor transport system ATP-binding protein [Desulfallas thermosapovorans DSM 6562]
MPGQRNLLIELQRVSYSYPAGNSPVLQDINARVEKAQFIAVIGPNGSGKSTLARIMAGLLTPTGGRVLVDGMDTAVPDTRKEIRRRVGLVLQNPENQLVAAVVEEDVAFGPENLGLPPGQVRHRVEEALSAVGLGKMRQRPPHMLSGGEKQRLAIAGILALRPLCVVLDEPTSMLDPLARQEVFQVLRRLAAGGTAVVLVTHHMDEAAVADRVWVLGHGSMLADDKPAAVFSEVKLLHDLGLALPEAGELARCMAGHGLEPPAGICTLDDMVEYLCSVLK